MNILALHASGLAALVVGVGALLAGITGLAAWLVRLVRSLPGRNEDMVLTEQPPCRPETR